MLFSQGVQAQTVANFYQAFDADLTIIPVINKVLINVVIYNYHIRLF